MKPAANADFRLHWLTAAALCFGIAAWNPQLQLTRTVGTYLFVYDITQSMNVQDARWDGESVSRLEYARSLSRATLDRLPCGSRIGIGLFVERQTRPILAPLEVCAHRLALDDVLAHLDWRMAWAAESHIDFGSIDALAGLRRDMHGTSLVLFTDGDQAPPDTDDHSLNEASRYEDVRGILLGVGGTEPQPVPRLGAHGHVDGYWTARSGLDDPDAIGPSKVDHNVETHLGYFRNSIESPMNGAPAAQAKNNEPSLSWRHDEVLKKVAMKLHLLTDTARSPAQLESYLQELGTRHAKSALALGNGFACLGMLALLISLLPERQRALSKLWTLLRGRGSKPGMQASPLRTAR